MPGNPRTAGIREFDRLFRQGTLLGRSEAELLDLFVRSRDEYAFEALVTRHGPMVLRTCRALLPDPLGPAEPRSIEHRLSTLEAKLDRLLELVESPDH